MLMRAYYEASCLWRSLNPTMNGPNTLVAKLSTLILMVVWASLTLGVVQRDPGDVILVVLTAFVFALVGRMWGVEATYWLDRFGTVTINFGGDDDGNE